MSKYLVSKRNNVNKLLYIPIIVVQIYLIATIILYMFGPWEWPTKNSFMFYMYLILYQGALYLGYTIAIKNPNNIKNISLDKQYNTEIFILRYLKYAVYINFIITLLMVIRSTGLSTISINQLLEKVVLGLSNPAQQYASKFNSSQFGGRVLTYLVVITAPFLWGVIPLGLYYFSKLKKVTKILLISSIILECFKWIANGTNKGIFDIAIIISIVYCLKSINKNKVIKQKTKRVKSKKYKIYFFVVILLSVVLMYFSNSIGDRVGENWYNYSIVNGGVPITDESILMKLCPNILKPTLIMISSYLTQGYYAMSIALDKPFFPMFGVGNSMFLIENFTEVIGVDLFSYTYQTQLGQYGWDPLVNWHSFYTWVANDVHFIGVIIVMLLLGYLFGSLYKDIIKNNNPFCIVLMCLVGILFLYIPANNQVMSYPTTFMAFWGNFVMWILTKKIRYTK